MKMNRWCVLWLMSWLFLPTAMGAPIEQRCVKEYYEQLQRYADDPSRVDVVSSLKNLFQEDEGFVYNDLKEHIEGEKSLPDRIFSLTSYIGLIYNSKNIKVRFHVDLSQIRYKYVTKPGFGSKDVQVTYAIVPKTVSGIGFAPYSCYELLEILNQKILSIQEYHNVTDFLSALKYYEDKQYAKAFQMFRESAEESGDVRSAYWLAIMLLKKQGCASMCKTLRESMALFWLAKLGSKQGARRILNVLQVDRVPYTDCQKPFNNGLLSSINSKGLYGFINENGQAVIDYRYNYATSFNGGLALVVRGHKCGAIDPRGRVVIPIIYDRIWREGSDLYAKKGDLEYLLDKNGNVQRTIQNEKNNSNNQLLGS